MSTAPPFVVQDLPRELEIGPRCPEQLSRHCAFGRGQCEHEVLGREPRLTHPCSLVAHVVQRQLRVARIGLRHAAYLRPRVVSSPRVLLGYLSSSRI